MRCMPSASRSCIRGREQNKRSKRRFQKISRPLRFGTSRDSKRGRVAVRVLVTVTVPMRYIPVLLVAAALAASGCSGSSQNQIRTAPFTEEHARYFDDSVDFVEDIEGLGGRVAQEWQTQIDGLSRESELIAPARIETVLLGSDIDGARNYTLTAVVDQPIHGRSPENDHVALRVSEGQSGFNTVNGKEARLQAGRYLLFVRWYTDGAGQVRAHWHLSPFSDGLVARVQRIRGNQIGSEERIVRTEGEVQLGDAGR
jgi:hypothetical protein